MHADELIRTGRVFRQAANRKRRRVRRKDNIFTNHGFGLFNDIRFHVRAFKNRFDNQINVFEVVIIICRFDTGEEFFGGLFRHATARDFLVQNLFRVIDGLLRFFHRTVE